jgi:hypothetical protein
MPQDQGGVGRDPAKIEIPIYARRTCPQKLEVFPPRSVPGKPISRRNQNSLPFAWGPMTIALFSSGVRLLLTIFAFFISSSQFSPKFGQ